MSDNAFLEAVLARWPQYVRIGKVTGQVRCYGPAWDFCREVVWNCAEGLCQECFTPVAIGKGDWQSVHCAHRKSKGSGGSDLPSNLRALCISCHAKEHSGNL